MDSLAAKDLGCLLGGYYKLLVDPSVSVFRLGRPKVRVHRIPAEEGVCGRFAVIEGVCYESLSSEQKLFHFKRSLFNLWLWIKIFHITCSCHHPVRIRIETPVMVYHHNINNNSSQIMGLQVLLHMHIFSLCYRLCVALLQRLR